MSERATASFEITSWDEQPYDDQDGIRLSRTRVVKAFRGEIEGESTAELLMAVAGEDSAAYVGVERVSGQVQIDLLPDGGHLLTLDYRLG